MATLKRAVQLAVNNVEPAKPATLGVDLADAGQAAIAAHRARNGSRMSKVIVRNGVNFEELGKEIADIFLGNESDIKAARDALNQQARVSRAIIWLGAAEQVSNEDEAKTLCASFKESLEARGHKRAAADASDFKTFIIAYMKSPDEVVGAVADSPDYHAAMKELRAIKNDGERKASNNSNNGPRKPGAKTMEKIVEAISRMDAEQCEKLYAALRKRTTALDKAKTKKAA